MLAAGRRQRLGAIFRRIHDQPDIIEQTADNFPVDRLVFNQQNALAGMFEQQSRQMQASINDNETALAAALARVSARIQAREAAAHAAL